MSVPVQRSFAGGEIAPSMYARPDSAKYATGARVIRNFIIRRHGGLELRPGTKFIAESKNSAVQCRLVPFILDATSEASCYVLEFGANYIRFYQSGARVTTSGVAAWANGTAYRIGDLVTQGGSTYYCIAAHTSVTATNQPGGGSAWHTVWYKQTGTIYEIPSPYATADLMNIQLTQSGNTIALVHPSYAPRELTRTSSTRWVLSAITFGPSISAPTNVAGTGGAAGTIRYWAVTAVKEGSREESLPGLYSSTNRVPSTTAPVSLTWNGVPHGESYNVYRSTDGKTYGLIQSAGGTPVATEDTNWVDANEQAATTTLNTWVAAAGQLRNVLAVSATVRAYDGKYTVKLRTKLASASDAALTTRGRLTIYYSRDGEARVSAGTFEVDPIEGTGVSEFTGREYTIDVPDNAYTALTIDVVPEVFAEHGSDTFYFELDASAAGAPYDRVTWQAGVTGFTDDGSDPDFSLAPPLAKNLFGAYGNWPSAVTNTQQRRLYANTAAEPEKVWGSRIGVPTSFTISTPLQDDDSIEFSMVNKQSNAVKHLLDLGRLIVFTAGSVLACGDDDGALTPTTVFPRKIAKQGIGSLPPLEVDDSAIYVQGRGTIVRDLQPVEAGGAFGGYHGNDLSVFAAHLFDGYTIVDWAYAETPHSIVWAVRSDGVLLSLTYLREHGIWGWTRHDTDGDVERVCVVPEGDKDAVYVVVKRTIGGATKRYVERFATPFVVRVAGPLPDPTTPDNDHADAFFVDSGVSYDGWHTSTRTMILSGGSAWDNTEQLTLTASASTFASGDVGDAIHLIGADGSLVICTIESFTSATVVKVRPDRTVPAGMRSTAIGNGSTFVVGETGFAGQWGFARDSISGLSHLEGKEVAVLADGFVVASPNNRKANGDRNYTARSVASGVVTLNRPYVVIHAGLPFIGDLVPHEVDATGRSVKDREAANLEAMLFVQGTRGVWAGRPEKPTAANPTNGLDELRPRQAESYDDPPDLRTERVEIAFSGVWDKSGRYGPFLVRQVDPLPLTILAVSPKGYGA